MSFVRIAPPPLTKNILKYLGVWGFALSFLLLLFSCGKDDNEPVKKSDKALITSFKIGSSEGTINKDNSIKVNVPFGTDISKLKAIVEISPKATIDPDPSKDNDYTNTKKFTVTAEDGTTKDYKVTVKEAKNDKTEIKSWKFGSKAATISGTDINIALPFGTDISKLKAIVEISPKATIDPDPSKDNDYTNTKKFTVTAEDGTTSKEYDVKVSAEAIDSWTGGWRDDDAFTATITGDKIKLDVNSADFIYKVTKSSGVTINPDPQTITDWTTEQSFTATGNGKTKTYKVKVTVGGKDIIKVNDLNELETKINTAIGKPNGNTTDYNYIDVSSVNSMQELFKDKTNFNGDISKWDVSNVKYMRAMFQNATSFNQNIGSWDVSKVIDMTGIFYTASVFNQDISKWIVSKVESMNSMFKEARSFNQDIGNWTVSNVINMNSMFSYAKAFNQPLKDWDVSKVTDMKDMFSEAETFNQDISGWTVSNVITMQSMFYNAEMFNKDISGWTVSKVENMSSMFSNAKAFNQPLKDWDVSKVTNMRLMFYNTAFNQDISGWTVSNVTTMNSMFSNAKAFNQDISGWNVSKVTIMIHMFKDATVFNQNISGWDVSNVTNCQKFSEGATAFQPANKPKFKCSE